MQTNIFVMGGWEKKWKSEKKEICVNKFATAAPIIFLFYYFSLFAWFNQCSTLYWINGMKFYWLIIVFFAVYSILNIFFFFVCLCVKTIFKLLRALNYCIRLHFIHLLPSSCSMLNLLQFLAQFKVFK